MEEFLVVEVENKDNAPFDCINSTYSDWKLKKKTKQDKSFMMAGKWDYNKKLNIINKMISLGGQFVDMDKCWNPSCTHVIVKDNEAAEKMMEILVGLKAGRIVKKNPSSGKIHSLLAPKKKVVDYEKPKVFMSSEDWEHDEKEIFGETVRSLGGVFLDEADWNASCTHVLAKNFNRTPTVLKALETGTTIVTKNFLTKSDSLGEWDKEDGYIMDFPTDLANEHMKEKIFLLAGRWRACEKNNIIQKICALGARVLDNDEWDDSCTHVIAANFVMSEKIMAAVAAGRWVLDRSFVDKSYQVGLWQEESLYQSSEVVINHRIAWERLGEEGGLFSGMKAVFLMEEHEEQIKNVYTRIIRAGGGEVVQGVDLDSLVDSSTASKGSTMTTKVEVCALCTSIFVSAGSLSEHVKKEHQDQVEKYNLKLLVDACSNKTKGKAAQTRKLAKHGKCNCKKDSTEISESKKESTEFSESKKDSTEISESPETWPFSYVRKITSPLPTIEAPEITHIFVDPSVLVKGNPRYVKFQKWFRFAQNKLNIHHLYYKYISQKIKDNEEMIQPEDWSIVVWKPCATTVRVQKSPL